MSPATGIIQPDHIAEVIFHHEEHQTVEEFVDGVPKNCWCEDSRDKEVILLVKVRGSCTTETKIHRIRVRGSICGKSTPKDQKSKNPTPLQENVLRRSEFLGLSCPSSVVDHLRNLDTP